ncbi:MAG: helix-turn-helix domain-containing protein [Planctomycetales bacterium]|nr:helix-turn-helix domain-containing protein [Planctomycetales bacterium]
MSNFVSLADAAKKLGVSEDELKEMRSRGDIFGYRDGASWKFKPEEIERVASEMFGSALDEDPAGSSILVSESDIGLGSKHGSSIGSDVSSDVALVPDDTGSDVRLVAEKKAAENVPMAASDDDDDELSLMSEDEDIITTGSGSGKGSDVEITGDLGLDSSVQLGSGVGSDVNLAGGSELIRGDSDPAIDSSGLDFAGSDLELVDEDDLVLSGGSDLALANDSGINLMSPADSGISLEDEPLDLAASGISGLDLAVEGSDVENPSAGGSAVDFQQDEEFQLSPSGVIETDEDSGSQVIELEDSSEFGDAAVALPSGDAFGDAGFGEEGGFGDGFDAAPSAPAAAMMGVPEVPYNSLQVVGLLTILLVMCLSGVLMSDIVRNMWMSQETSDLTSGFTKALVSAIGK